MFVTFDTFVSGLSKKANESITVPRASQIRDTIIFTRLQKAGNVLRVYLCINVCRFVCFPLQPKRLEGF